MGKDIILKHLKLIYANCVDILNVLVLVAFRCFEETKINNNFRSNVDGETTKET